MQARRQMRYFTWRRLFTEIHLLKYQMAAETDEVDLIYRLFAYVCALIVGGAVTILGGSWLITPICLLIVWAIAAILPKEMPEKKSGQRFLAALRTIRFSSRPVRLVCAILLIGGVAALEYNGDALGLPLGFEIYLVSIFLAAVFFGNLGGIAAWLVSLPAVAYFVIPPFDSFAIATLQDFVHFSACIIISGIAVMIGLLLYNSSVLADDKRKRRAQDLRHLY